LLVEQKNEPRNGDYSRMTTLLESLRASTQDEPQYYIFVANSVEWEPYTTGDQIVIALAQRSIWLASRFTPFRPAYKHGDQVLLYVAGPKARHFLGDAVVAGPIAVVTPAERQVANKMGLEGYEERIPLTAVRLWEEPVPIQPLVLQLGFIRDKKYYGLHLRRATVRIPVEDYLFILRQAGVAMPSA
jgi:predicted RNA-binding protein